MATKSTRANSNVIESWKMVELTNPNFNILKKTNQSQFQF
jgi:hypothetical protein